MINTVIALCVGLVIGVVIGALRQKYVYRTLVNADKFLNKELLNGRKGETVSTRGGRAVKRIQMGKKAPGDWKWCVLCRIFDILDKNHCLDDYNRVYGIDADPTVI